MLDFILISRNVFVKLEFNVKSVSSIPSFFDHGNYE